MTSGFLSGTTKPSEEVYLPALKKAAERMLVFALFFTLTNSMLSVWRCITTKG